MADREETADERWAREAADHYDMSTQAPGGERGTPEALVREMLRDPFDPDRQPGVGDYERAIAKATTVADGVRAQEPRTADWFTQAASMMAQRRAQLAGALEQMRGRHSGMNVAERSAELAGRRMYPLMRQDLPERETARVTHDAVESTMRTLAQQGVREGEPGVDPGRLRARALVTLVSGDGQEPTLEDVGRAYQHANRLAEQDDAYQDAATFLYMDVDVETYQAAEDEIQAQDAAELAALLEQPPDPAATARDVPPADSATALVEQAGYASDMVRSVLGRDAEVDRLARLGAISPEDAAPTVDAATRLDQIDASLAAAGSQIAQLRADIAAAREQHLAPARASAPPAPARSVSGPAVA